jgi:2-dehydropantoate 2-reductase
VSSPLVIVGAGALGQSFAALLAAAGQSVVLFATPRGAEQLRIAGGIVLGGAIDLEVKLDQLTLTSFASEVPDGCMVVFTTKGQDLPGAIEELTHCRPAWVAGVQNGVVKDDALIAAFGAEKVVGAATIFGAVRQDDGRIRVGGRGMTYFGEFDLRPSERVLQAATTFDSAGIPTQARDDIADVLWSKVCNATGVFGICVLARVSNPHLFSDADLMRAYLSLLRETAAVAAAHGARVGNYAGFPPIRTYAESDEQSILASLPPRPHELEPSYASMTNDLLAGRPMEVEAIFGDIVARAERVGVDVPCLRFTRDILRGINHGGSWIDA